MNLEEFIHKECKNCNELCEKGLIEKENFIRCVDKDIYIAKSIISNKE